MKFYKRVLKFIPILVMLVVLPRVANFVTVRAFVLKPLLDLAPDVVLPGQGRARDFLDKVADQRIELLDTAAEP